MKSPDDQSKILELFKQGPALLENALNGMTDSDLDYVPANGGWTIRQIVHHIVDGDDFWKTWIRFYFFFFSILIVTNIHAKASKNSITNKQRAISQDSLCLMLTTLI